MFIVVIFLNITPQLVDCEDSDSRCGSWANDGWCDRCTDYMYEHCKLSCQVCEDGGGGQGMCADQHLGFTEKLQASSHGVVTDNITGLVHM